MSVLMFMPSSAARMMLAALCWAAFMACVRPQIIINTQINGASTLSPDALNQSLQNSSLPPASDLQSSQSSQIVVQVCPTGTYAEGNASTCTPCPAGTASNITASTSSANCLTCSAGTWSFQEAATCTQCVANTFSPSFGAVNSSTCLACPPHANSTLGTTTILNCLCADAYFFPGNALQVLDPPSAVQFPSWTSLPLDTVVLDAPHLACAS